MRTRSLLSLLVLASACSRDLPVEVPLFSSTATASVSAEEDAIVAIGDAVNAQLEARGSSYRLHQAEWLTEQAPDNAGNVYFFANVGNKRLPADFVPGDPRRAAWSSGTNITNTIDQTEGNPDGLTPVQTSAAIDRAMATWNSIECSTIPITSGPNSGSDLGYTEFLLGHGGSPLIFADLTHAGWEQSSFFVLLFGESAPNVIAVTLTYVFAGTADNNKYADVAFREINYNDTFLWRIDGNFPSIDVETVALHEAGHGLSQGHFGKLFRTTSNGKFHFAPRAVMNAGYTGIQQTISETDNAGHCSNWASWPNT